MTRISGERIAQIEARFGKLQALMASGTLVGDEFVQAAKDYAELEPVARAAAVIAIVIAGVTIIFSEGGGGVRKLAFVGLGIAVMFAAVSFFLDFFGFAGGALL